MTNKECQKIFAIGLSRTGTTSLHCALILLGFSAVHYPAAAGQRWLSGDFSDRTTSAFQAFSDAPTCVFFKQLHKSHPNAKFVYTRRDPIKWLNSCERHFIGRPLNKMSSYGLSIRLATYGIVQFERERFMEVFQDHEEKVKEYFADKPDSLLTIDLDEGPDITRLGRFLNVSTPEIPWPHLKTPNIGKFAEVSEKEVAARREELYQLLS